MHKTGQMTTSTDLVTMNDKFHQSGNVVDDARPNDGNNDSIIMMQEGEANVG